MRASIKELFEIAKTISDYADEFKNEDAEHLAYLFAEANGTRALDFFDIVIEEDIVIFPDNTNYEDASNILNAYLAIVEAGDEQINIYDEIEVPEHITDKDDYIHRIYKEALRYNEYTEAFRGADDGTFDYAGTFVITILEILSKYKSH